MNALAILEYEGPPHLGGYTVFDGGRGEKKGEAGLCQFMGGRGGDLARTQLSLFLKVNHI